MRLGGSRSCREVKLGASRLPGAIPYYLLDRTGRHSGSDSASYTLAYWAANLSSKGPLHCPVGLDTGNIGRQMPPGGPEFHSKSHDITSLKTFDCLLAMVQL